MIPMTVAHIRGMAFAMADLPLPVTGEVDWAETQETLNQINFGLAELAGHIAAHAPDALTMRVDLAVNAAAEWVMVPDDLLAVRAVYAIDSGGQRVQLEQFSPGAITASRMDSSATPAVSLQGGRLWFSPAMSAACTVELWYVRRFAWLIDDTDHIRPEITESWARYVVAYLAVYLLDKEESDSRPARDVMARTLAEIQDHASRRIGPRSLSRASRTASPTETLPRP